MKLEKQVNGTMNVLIVDDEEKITEILALYFKKNGDTPYISHTGEKAIQIIEETSIDLIILDLMLPDMDGEDICEYVKRYYNIPIIMLTAKIAIDDKLKGFRMGADDYVVKPFHPKEVVVRAERLRPNQSQKEILQFGDIKIYTNENNICLKGKTIHLTQHEFIIICLLIENPRHVFSREDLINKIEGIDSETNPRVIDQHIKNIRKKVGADVIQTVFGLGYKMNEKVMKNEI